MFRPEFVNTEVLVNGEWVKKPFKNLVKGDIFRTYKDGVLNTDSSGNWKFEVDYVPKSENGIVFKIHAHPID